MGIRPSALPAAGSVANTDAIIVDDGAVVSKATPTQIVDAAIPLASQAEAEAGTDNAKRVTPLRVKQAMDANMATTDALASTAAGEGAALVSFIQSGTGAVARTAEDKLREVISAEDFGAVGDCAGTAGSGTDNAAAIQAALDATGALGGGIVYLPPSAGGYRITSGLKLPTNVTLAGAWGHGDPYSSPGALVADFADANQWVVEPKTTSAGAAIAYNVMLTALPDGVTYNCGVRDLSVRVATGAIVPYGGVRFHGCPGSHAENLSIAGTGCGLLVNQCSGGGYRAHCIPLYYGFAAWDDVNACSFDVYATQDASVPTTVPAGYQLPFMTATAGTLVSGHAMAVEHDTRPFAGIVGSSASAAVNNDIKLVGEGFNGGLFLFNADGAEITRLYLEDGTGHVDYGIAATGSRFAIRSLHAIMPSGTLFDLGAGLEGSVSPGGTITTTTVGTGPYGGDGSRLIVHNTRPIGDTLSLSTLRKEVHYPDIASAWIAPTLTNSWANTGGTLPPAGYMVSGGWVTLRGHLNGGSGSAFTLPAGLLPQYQVNVATNGGVTTIDTNGNVTPSSSPMNIDGARFRAYQ